MDLAQAALVDPHRIQRLHLDLAGRHAELKLELLPDLQPYGSRNRGNMALYELI